MKSKKPEVYPDLTSEVASGFLLPEVLFIGVDEVGRGCLAGPVVAGAAVLNPECFYDLHFKEDGTRPPQDQKNHHSILFKIKDSKMIPEPERAPLAMALKSFVKQYAIAEASVQEIESLNILYASHLAMERAVFAIEDALGRKANLILVDGNLIPKQLSGRAQALIKGDQKSLTIACASILAKVYRDQLMEAMDSTHPGYEFKRHKGYGTPLHRARIAELGITAIHRAGFAGVKEYL